MKTLRYSHTFSLTELTKQYAQQNTLMLALIHLLPVVVVMHMCVFNLAVNVNVEVKLKVNLNVKLALRVPSPTSRAAIRHRASPQRPRALPATGRLPTTFHRRSAYIYTRLTSQLTEMLNS